MMQQIIDTSQTTVYGDVQLMLYKGNVIVAGGPSATDSLFDESVATFEGNVVYVIY